MTAPRPTQTCKSCEQPIRWAVTEKGHRIPVDPEPTATGNLLLEERAGGAVFAVPVPQGTMARALRYASHFATCPHAAHHRHPRARATQRRGAER